MKYSINVNGNEKIPFNNNVNYCVGTGRMGLALTKEYYEQYFQFGLSNLSGMW